MENRKYWLSEDQLDSIDHYKRMFELHADSIRELCSTERDDVVYGFELGGTYSHLRQCYMEMMELYDVIRSQKCSG